MCIIYFVDRVLIINRSVQEFLFLQRTLESYWKIHAIEPFGLIMDKYSWILTLTPLLKTTSDDDSQNIKQIGCVLILFAQNYFFRTLKLGAQ